MPYPSQCPTCKTVLGFPERTPPDPVMCPVCNSRYKIEGRLIAHLSFTDFYGLLGISQYADQHEIKKAIRAAILKHHPDRNPGDPDAEIRIRNVLSAKEILSDTTKRVLYDSVYNAKPLPLWKKKKPEPARAAYAEPQRESDGSDTARSRGEQYYSYDESAEPVGRHRPGDPDEVDPMQEVILLQGGVPINLSSRRAYRKYTRVRMYWQISGSVIGALAGLIFGILNGNLIGAAILGLLGAFLGFLFTSYPGGLVVIIFFIVRMFLAGLLLAIIVSRYETGIWFPPGILKFFRVIQFTMSAGAAAFGLWAISTGRFIGYEPFTVHALSLRSAALGAWLGAITGLLVLFVQTHSANMAQSTIYYWFLAMTVWFILDTWIFGRTWVFIRKLK